MGIFARKSEAAPEAPAKAPAKLKAELTLEAVNRKLETLTRRCEAAEAANALAFTIISDILRDPHAGSLSVRLIVAAQSVEFESASVGIRALLDRIEKAGKADSARQLSRASGRLQVHSGAGGRNW